MVRLRKIHIEHEKLATKLPKLLARLNTSPIGKNWPLLAIASTMFFMVQVHIKTLPCLPHQTNNKSYLTETLGLATICYGSLRFDHDYFLVTLSYGVPLFITGSIISRSIETVN